MSDMLLSERIRLAIAFHGGVRLDLDRDQALSLLRTIEAAERLPDVADTVSGMVAETDALRRQMQGVIRSVIRQCLFFSAAIISLQWVLMQ